MSYSAWKQLERRHAKQMGGERLWRQDYSESAPDGETEADVWDAKCFARFSVVALFVKCERKYRKWNNGRRFHLVLYSREHPKAGDFVLLRSADFLKMLASERELQRRQAQEK